MSPYDELEQRKRTVVELIGPELYMNSAVVHNCVNTWVDRGLPKDKVLANVIRALHYQLEGAIKVATRDATRSVPLPTFHEDAA